MKPMLMVVNFILVLAALAASPAYGQTELYNLNYAQNCTQSAFRALAPRG
jgi:hypothetical protein